MGFQRRNQSLDIYMLIALVLLWTIGTALIYSTTNISPSLADLYANQIVWICCALLIIIALGSIPIQYFFHGAYSIYAITIIGLLCVIYFGISAKGAVRWVSLGFVNIQPAEFAKVGLILILARYLSHNTVSLTNPRSLIVPLVMVIVPFLLVLRQPDLGTALVFAAIAIPMLYWSGLTVVETIYMISPVMSVILAIVPLITTFGTDIPLDFTDAIPWTLFFLSLCILLWFYRPSVSMILLILGTNIACGVFTSFFWNSFLQPYQKARIISFINPQADPYGAGYQVIQSKAAIGSGGWVGTGYLQGSQTRLSYLPEQHTDFIFSSFGEQFGLIGCIIAIVLFLFIICRAFLYTHKIHNRFMNLMIVGAVSALAFHIFVNIAMTVGFMPVTGLPLPFFSYGGSFTLTIALLMGLILNAGVADQDF